ncbi:E3 ubiquitin-protein ligase SGR9, amyloplastic-like [Telopea speciosissima]|uniref:E3 ubiquitin-protein ligase SGR9, amyloplastic-like n=1 Tax=Telopea speciosissima TaxID=54955 RepID=UPI001CC3C51F|nr:E3 ubiquitin-protein ligase SGR9, amyloplastic-like [Telopea speciosissima]
MINIIDAFSMDEKKEKDPSEIIMAAIYSLNTHQFSDLMNSVSSEFRRHDHHLCSLLRSSTRFPLTLLHLQTISLHHKALLIARYLLSTLTHLTHFLETSPSSSSSLKLNLRDLDAALLLMLLCEVHQQAPQALQGSPAEWHIVLNDYVVRSRLLTLAGLGVSSSAVLTPYVDLTIKCRRFLDAVGCGDEMVREVAASVAAVVVLPSVEIGGCGGVECVICREEIREGREMCGLPCEHLFHWMCVVPWLKKRNTCPCCRFQLPTDDVFGEIQRLWGILITKNGMNSVKI